MPKKNDPSKTTAQELYEAAFLLRRDPRSVEYRAGVYAALQLRIGEKTTTGPCPYAAGSASQDAWLSGLDEGHQRGRAFLDDRFLSAINAGRA